MPRLFTGIKIPPAISQWLITLQSGLKNVHWVEAENYHITLRFLGDVDERTALEYDSLLDQIRFEPFSLKLQGVGSFGHRKPRILWAGVMESEPLTALQRKHELAATALGLEPEGRKYKPHVTLLRPRQIAASQIERYKLIHGLFESPRFEVKDFQLFSARSLYGGGPYLVEENYPKGCNVEACHELAKQYL